MWVHTAVIRNPKNDTITIDQEFSKTADCEQFKTSVQDVCKKLNFELLLIHSHGLSQRTLDTLK